MQTSDMTQASTSSKTLPSSNDLVGVIVVLLQPYGDQDQRRYEELQKLRQRHDQAFVRWLPHITLIPPFTLTAPPQVDDLNESSSDELDAVVQRHEPRLSEIAQAALEVCKGHAAHSLLLDQVSTFPLRKYTNVHLRPYPTNFEDKGTRSAAAQSQVRDEDVSSRRIVNLQKNLDHAVGPLLRPDTAYATESSAKPTRRTVFKPHVSVGQSTSPKATWQLCNSAERMLNGGQGQPENVQRPGILCRVDHVQLMVKRKGQEGPYRIHQELSLSHDAHES